MAIIKTSGNDIGHDLYIDATGNAPDFEALIGDGRVSESFDPDDWTTGDYTYSELDRALYLTGRAEVLWYWDGGFGS